jgi:hypothetical protein
MTAPVFVAKDPDYAQRVRASFARQGAMTLIGAEMTGRKAFLMELDPLYCDVIVQRFENFTGKKAERQA